MTRQTTAIRLNETTHDRLKAVADRWGLSMNYLVGRAVDEFLDDLLDEPVLTGRAARRYAASEPMPSEVLEGAPRTTASAEFLAACDDFYLRAHPEDRKPEPTDGPEYHADLAAWQQRNGGQP